MRSAIPTASEQQSRRVRWVPGSCRATLLLAMLMAVISVLAPTSASAAARVQLPPALAQSEPTIPVVLVHGLAADSSTWGYRPDGPSTGLYQALIEAGYEPGRTLFLADYRDMNNGDYAEIYRRVLMPTIDQALSATGARQVDIVAHSMGGLVTRYYVASPGYRGDVRTLIMIATPNQGSGAANLLRLLTAARARQELAPEVRRRARQSRQSQVGKLELLRPPPGAKTPDDYVTARILETYAFVYGRFLGRQGLWPFERAVARAWRLIDWLLAQQEVNLAAQLARLGLPMETGGYRSGEILGRVPRAEEAIARSDLEVLAMLLTDRLGGGWGRQKGLLAPIYNLGGKLVQNYAPEAARLMRIDPGSTAVARLVETRPALALADSGRYEIAGNYFLDYWNRRDLAARQRDLRAERVAPDELPARRPKYVVIAGVTANVWSGLPLPGLRLLRFPTVDDNDLVVEVASAFLPLELGDAFYTVRGLSANHLGIKQSGPVVDIVLRHLRDYLPPARSLHPSLRDGRWSTGGALALIPWDTRYILVDLAGRANLQSGDGAAPPLLNRVVFELELEAYRRVRFSRRPADVRAWLIAYGPFGLVRRELPSDSGLVRASVRDLPAETEAVWIAVRLEVPPPDGESEPPPARLSYRLSVTERPVEPVSDGSPYLAANAPARLARAEVRELLRSFFAGVRAFLPALDPVLAFGFAPVGGDAVPDREATEEVEPSGDTVLRAEARPDTAHGGTPGAAGGRAPTAGDDAPVDATRGGGGVSTSDAGFARASPAAADNVPLIVVQRTTKQTTLWNEDREYHQRWEWSFGDGSGGADDDPSRTTWTATRFFVAPGTYVVTARSISNKGRELRSAAWTVEVPPPPPGLPFVPVVRTFSLDTVVEPTVDLRIAAPKAWLVGERARITVAAQVSDPPYSDNKQVRLDPGPDFDVIWEKPGKFRVLAAVRVRLSYRFPERSVFIVNTYLREVPVEVLTTGLTGPP